MKIRKTLVIVCPILCIVLALLCNYFAYYNFLDSDMSGEMILADTLAHENKLISSNWWYSTELRLLNTQLVAVPLFKFFSNWRVIRILTNLIFYFMTAGAYLYFNHNFTRFTRTMAIFSVGLLFIPISDRYFSIVLMGGYYLPHLILGFIYLAMTFRLLNGEMVRRRYSFYFIWYTLSFILGCSGPRYLMYIQIPIFFAVILYHILFSEKDKMIQGRMLFLLKCPNVRAWLHILCGCVAGGTGMMINSVIFPLFFHFKPVTGMDFADFRVLNLGDRISLSCSGLLEVFGYKNAVKLFGFDGFKNLCVLMLVAILIYMYILMIKEIKKYTEPERFFILFCISALLVNLFFFICTDAVFNNKEPGGFIERYYMPILIYLIPMAGIYLRNNRSKKRIWIYTWLGVFLLSSVITSFKILAEAKPMNNKTAVLSWLKSHDLNFGYATFWNANIITEMSNGEIEMGNLENLQSLQYYYWLTPQKYYEEPYTSKQPIFLLLTRAEFGDNSMPIVEEGNLAYADGEYVVCVFDKNVIARINQQ